MIYRFVFIADMVVQVAVLGPEIVGSLTRLCTGLYWQTSVVQVNLHPKGN